MKEQQYLIREEGYSLEHQIQRNELTSIRLFKIMDYLTVKNPSLIPFETETPIVSFLDYATFEKQTKISEKFEELPRYIKNTVKKAEKIKFFDLKFRKYLQDRDITPKEYQSKNPKAKEDLFYDWLFMNNLDADVLNV